MRAARVVVFPVRGRNWCFARSSLESCQQQSEGTGGASSFKHLWNQISKSNNKLFAPSNLQLLIDFASTKMNNAWIGLGDAPPGTIKNKIHSLGLRLLSRVPPSEIFLKSITNDLSTLHVLYPSILNAKLVRRRLRHIALRGTVMHKKYFYGSVSLLPVTSVFMVLPLPNIPFFWILFRTYSHWRALQGSEKLLCLVSDSDRQKITAAVADESRTVEVDTEEENHASLHPTWVLQPSKELDELLKQGNVDDGLTECSISKICNAFNLNSTDVLKYQKLQ